MIEELSVFFSVRTICHQLNISTSAYYRFINGQSYCPSPKKQFLLKAVKASFDFHKKRYGSRRIKEDLKDKDINIGIYRIRTLMKEQNLFALQPKKFVPRTTQTNPSLIRSPNLLLDDSNLPTAPNEVIVGDITYLYSVENGLEQWLYLATWLDIFSHKIVGWKVDESMTEDLIIDSFKQVIRHRQPSEGLIVHSDGGGQYASHNFRALIDTYDFRQSMTRKENHYDNSFAESLFSRIKTELDDLIFKGLEDAQLRIFEYIEAYYNTIRKHSSIGYISPNQFENQYWMKLE